MGMGKYGTADKYERVVEKDQLKLIEHTKSPQGMAVKKIIVFKYKSKVRYRRKNTHRQDLTRLVIKDIVTGAMAVEAEAVEAAPAPAETEPIATSEPVPEITPAIEVEPEVETESDTESEVAAPVASPG